MFGSNDFNQQTNDDPAMLDNVKQLAQDPIDTTNPSTATVSDPPQSSSPFTPTSVPAATTATQSQASDSTPTTLIDDEHRAEPAEGFSSSALPASDDAGQTASSPDPITDVWNDQSASSTSAPEPAETPAIQSTSTPIQDSADDDSASTTSDQPQQTAQSAPDQNHLAGLKQQALQHLEPLADHVDGTPEEMFKTTMMMIQANDNHTLLEKALEAAKKIEDDKVRAKAMLDVINEINYFSQSTQDS